MCKDPCGKVDWAHEAAVSVGATVTAGVGLMVRLVCSRFDDGQLEHGRWILRWRVPVEALVAAGLTVWLGRAAAFVFAGVFAVSWLAAHGLRAELDRRSLHTVQSPAPQPERASAPSVPDPIEAELAEMLRDPA